MPWTTLIKSRRDWELVPNLHDYGSVRARFTWEQAREELAGLPGNQGLNIAHEAVVRHAEGPRAAHPAIKWLEKTGTVEEYSYSRLNELTNRFANVLRQLGVAKGDRVFVLAGRIPELYIAALGTFKNRSVFCPLFSAFGPEPIRARLSIGQAKVLVTTHTLYQRKVASIRAAVPSLEHVLLIGDDRQPSAIAGTEDWETRMQQAGSSNNMERTDPQWRRKKLPSYRRCPSRGAGTSCGACRKPANWDYRKAIRRRWKDEKAGGST